MTMLIPSTFLCLSLLSPSAAQVAQPSPSRGDPPPIYIPIVPTSHHATPTHSVFDSAPLSAPTLALDDRQKKKSKKGSKYKYHHASEGSYDDDLYALFPNPITILPPGKGKKGGGLYAPAPVPAHSVVIPPVNIPPVALFPTAIPPTTAPPPVVIPPVSIDMAPTVYVPAPTYPKGSSSSKKRSQNKKGQHSPAIRHPGYDTTTGIAVSPLDSKYVSVETNKSSSNKSKRSAKKGGGSPSRKQKNFNRGKNQDLVSPIIPISQTDGTTMGDGDSDVTKPIESNEISGAYAMVNPSIGTEQIIPAVNMTSIVGNLLIPAPTDGQQGRDYVNSTDPMASFEEIIASGIGNLSTADGMSDVETRPTPMTYEEAQQLIAGVGSGSGGMEIAQELLVKPLPPDLETNTTFPVDGTTAADASIPIIPNQSTPPPVEMSNSSLVETGDVLLDNNGTSTAEVLPLTQSPTVAPVSSSVTQASPTTQAPTAFPVLGIAETATRVISSEPVYLRIAGTFNPAREEAVFFDVLEENFGPYGRAYVGAESLKDIDLVVSFFPDAELAAQQRQKVTEEFLSTWAEVLVTFHVAVGNDMDTDQASQIVRRFFVASHKERFVGRLEDAGIEISSMLVFNDIPESIKASQDQIDYDDDFYDNNSVPDLEGSQEITPDTTNRSSAIVAAILSGGIILLALFCVILTNRRRQQEQATNVDVLKDGDIEYDNMSSDASSDRIAAYNHEEDDEEEDENDIALFPQERNERTGESYFQSITSCNSTVSSYPSPAPYRTVGEASDIHGSTSLMPDYEESFKDEQEAVEERALMLIDDTPDLVAAAALANQDSPPDFLDDQAPPSPIWSLDNFSNATPYSAADEGKERRRWHEVSHEADTLDLPDHCSAQDAEESHVDGEMNEEAGREIV